MIKKLLATLFLTISTAFAVPINISGIDFDSNLGLFKHGLIYINSPRSLGGTAEGVGKVGEIRDENGSLLWKDGDNGVELNFAFYDYVRTTELILNLDNTKIYGNNNGIVKMYVNQFGTFFPTGDFTTDFNNINSGDLFLEMNGAVNTNGFTVQGIDLGDSNSGNGLLNVVGGIAAQFYDRLTLDIDPSGMPLNLADMTFNFSTDHLSTAGYDYSGSADLSTFDGKPFVEPEPISIVSTLFLVLIGLSGISSKVELEPSKLQMSVRV